MTESKNEDNFGMLSAINGSLVEIEGLEKHVSINDLIKIEKYNILGEVIQIYSDHVVAQCFEDTFDLMLEEKVQNLNAPLSMELGPGLLGKVFDGIQRPLESIDKKSSRKGFLERGIDYKPLDRKKKWHFEPLLEKGYEIRAGEAIGKVKETNMIEHYILVPPGINGRLTHIAKEGDYQVEEVIYHVDTENGHHELNMIQRWAVTKKRPYLKRLKPDEPLITGLRVIDLLFPIAKGGTVAVPGGFGTGKTIIQQSLAKWCNADIIVFIGCGERGNEIADVLEQFSELKDPKTMLPLSQRTIIIANTSNMPVSAREASIFSGITMAEYYRDMGYEVALLADSTSRWAESLREISGLLEEMPAEEGYPAYLASKLSSFYERAGVVECLGSKNGNYSRIGSLTIIGSVSPPSGDFSEPVTSTTKRFVQAFWALDANLAYSKHYPAINWLDSYSNYPKYITKWYLERDIEWSEIKVNWDEARLEIDKILAQENELKNIAQLIGEDNLPENQQLDLFLSKLIREGFLIQNAFDSIDNYTSNEKLMSHVKLLLLLGRYSRNLLKEGVIIDDIKNIPLIDDIMRISSTIKNDNYEEIEGLKDQLIRELNMVKRSYGV